MLKFPKLLLPQRLVEADRNPFAFEMREQVLSADGEEIFDSGYWEPNALTNDGQSDMLNVWARETSAKEKWLCLLNMPGGAAPTKTSTISTISECAPIGTNAYARLRLLASSWSAPALDTGDEQIAAPQMTFGQFTGNSPVSHVGLISIGSTFTGTFFLYVSTAYHTANATSRTFVNGESYLVTLRDKQT